jgi:hypothetical protein
MSEDRFVQTVDRWGWALASVVCVAATFLFSINALGYGADEDALSSLLADFRMRSVIIAGSALALVICVSVMLFSVIAEGRRIRALRVILGRRGRGPQGSRADRPDRLSDQGRSAQCDPADRESLER